MSFINTVRLVYIKLVGYFIYINIESKTFNSRPNQSRKPSILSFILPLPPAPLLSIHSLSPLIVPLRELLLKSYFTN